MASRHNSNVDAKSDIDAFLRRLEQHPLTKRTASAGRKPQTSNGTNENTQFPKSSALVSSVNSHLVKMSHVDSPATIKSQFAVAATTSIDGVLGSKAETSKYVEHQRNRPSREHDCEVVDVPSAEVVTAQLAHTSLSWQREKTSDLPRKDLGAQQETINDPRWSIDTSTHHKLTNFYSPGPALPFTLKASGGKEIAFGARKPKPRPAPQNELATSKWAPENAELEYGPPMLSRTAIRKLKEQSLHKRVYEMKMKNENRNSMPSSISAQTVTPPLSSKLETTLTPLVSVTEPPLSDNEVPVKAMKIPFESTISSLSSEPRITFNPTRLVTVGLAVKLAVGPKGTAVIEHATEPRSTTLPVDTNVPKSKARPRSSVRIVDTHSIGIFSVDPSNKASADPPATSALAPVGSSSNKTAAHGASSPGLSSATLSSGDPPGVIRKGRGFANGLPIPTVGAAVSQLEAVTQQAEMRNENGKNEDQFSSGTWTKLNLALVVPPTRVGLD